MSEIFLNYFALSHPGKRRRNNQDGLLTPGGALLPGEIEAEILPLQQESEAEALLPPEEPAAEALLPENIPHIAQSCSSRDLQLFAVCDGMGGGSHGDMATIMSLEALQRLAGELNFSPQDEELTQQTLTRISQSIYEEKIQRQVSLIGAACVLLKIQGNHAQTINIGDCRGYLLRQNELIQLTKDHTQVNLYVAAGLLTPEQARQHPDRHQLTQYLGLDCREMALSPYYADTLELLPGDKLLLASDGLTDEAEPQEIKDILAAYPPRQAGELLWQLAMDKGGKDNISIVVIEAEAPKAATEATEDTEVIEITDDMLTTVELGSAPVGEEIQADREEN